MLKRLAALLSLTLLAALPAAAQQAPIKIGAILPLTGSGASYGVWMKGGTEIAVEEINAAGGIMGRKLQVIYEDHAADASKAVTGMRRLVEVEKVPFTLRRTHDMAIQPIGAQSKIVMMNGGGQSDNLANKDYLYNNIPVVSNEVGVLSDWLTKEKKFKAAVMIVANDEAGRNAAKSFRDRFTAGGGRVLAEEQVALDGNDFRAQLAKLKASGGDLLFISSYGRNVAIIADQARELGITIPMAALLVQVPEVMKAGGVSSPRGCLNPASPFTRKFKEKYKTAGTPRGRGGHEEERRPARRRGGKNAIESLKAFETISGKLVFQPNHAAVMDIEVGVLRDGKVEVEKIIKAAP
jgi:branched-chain amino acid transport system substrate-binding protein